MRVVMVALAAVLLLSCPGMGWAHEDGAVRGIVRDTGGSPLPHSVIQLEDTDGELVASGLGLGDGSFVLRAPAGDYLLRISYLSYTPFEQRVRLTAGSVAELAVELVAEPIELGELLVQGERVYSAASTRTVREFDIRVRPLRTAQDALRIAPGLFIAQHAGGGKAEQIFLRGFDADHGTDVDVRVDGMPVNMVSHGHGQGYADLHFVIPETIEDIEVLKGPYWVERGNLATAGAVGFETWDRLPRNELKYEVGEFATHNVTALAQLTEEGRTSAWVAAQFAATDGPFISPLDLRRANLMLKVHHRLESGAELSLDTSGFTSAWDASGQIPQRAVDSGQIDRFGAIDDLEGGTTSRQNLNLRYRAVTESGDMWLAQAYAFRYRFKLFSNFTFFREYPDVGDMIEQTDARTTAGARGRYVKRHFLGPLAASLTIGGDARADNVDVGLWHAPDRLRSEVRTDSRVFERNYALYVQEEIDLGSRVGLQLGLRGDYFTFDVDDRLDGVSTGVPHTSGYAQEGILSPKANLRVGVTDDVDLFVNYGSGFHSNDARAVVMSEVTGTTLRALQARGASEAEIDSVLAARSLDRGSAGLTTLPRAHGGEIGLRTRIGEWLSLGGAVWLLDLEEELVYVGDEGTTEPSGRTRRTGFDLEVRAQLLPWLWFDADVNYASGELRDEPEDANSIPLAPQWVSYGGLNVQHPSGWLGAVRYRLVDDRPANEDGSVVAEGSTVFDLVAGYQTPRFGVELVVENLLDTEWNEAQFDTESQLRGEPAPVSELHFTPGNPRNFRIGMSLFW